VSFASSALALGSSDFRGKPSGFQAGKQTGAAVWHDDERLHIEVTNQGARATAFSGKVCAKSSIVGLESVGLEEGDSVRLGPKGRCVWLKLTTRGGSDGFSLQRPSGVVFFDLKQGKRQLPPERIWVGAAGKHPTSSPFTYAQ
jgi:hypothetical protein